MPTLCLDLGNSSLKAALIAPDGAVAHPLRLPHDAPDAPERLTSWLRSLPAVEHAAIASVVPARTDAVAEAVRAQTGADVLRVHAGRRWPFTIGYATPETVGVDRLAAVCGAIDDGDDAPLVVVDAGTATTVEAVTSQRTYLGGAIAPGPELLAAALSRGTAQLPRADLGGPMPSAVGRSTGDALRAGTLGMFVHGVRGLVEATCAELCPSDPSCVRVVTTGGWAPLLASVHPRLADVRPHLVLVGLARVAALERDGG